MFGSSTNYQRQSNITGLNPGRVNQHVALPSNRTPSGGAQTLYNVQPTSYTPSAYNPVSSFDNSAVQAESLNVIDAPSSPAMSPDPLLPVSSPAEAQTTENSTGKTAESDIAIIVPPVSAATTQLTDVVTAPPTKALPAATDEVTREVTKQEQEMFANILKNLDDLTRPTKKQPTASNNSGVSSPELEGEEDQVSDPEDDELYIIKKGSVETVVDISLQPVGVLNQSEEQKQEMRKNGPVQQVDHFAGPLAVGRRVGLDIFKSMFQNALSKWIRNTAILIEFVFIAIDLSLDIASLATGNNSAYVAIHLTFILIGLLLALGDGFVHVVSEYCPCSCTGNRCSCCQALKNKVDAARIVLPNILLVPILICDLFDILVGGFEDASGTIGLIVFIIDILYTFVFLKTLNIIIAVKILFSLRSIKSFSENVDDCLRRELKLHKRRLFIYSCFLIHSFLHTVGEFFMLATVGVQIRYENSNPDAQTGVRVSLDLGAMCFIICILPFLQLFFFMITYNFWVQESLVSLMVDFEGLKSKIEVFLTADKKKEEQEETFLKIFGKRVLVNDVRDQLEKSIKKKSCWTKVIHPFANPAILFYLVFPLSLCYLIFFALAGKGYLAAESIRTATGIDSTATAITILSFIFNFIVNFYLIVGTVVAFAYYFFIFCIIVWACCNILACRCDKVLK